MSKSILTALSPLDGRYQTKLVELSPIASEYGLMRFRLIIEIRWLLLIVQDARLTFHPPIDASEQEILENFISEFDINSAEEIKIIEKTTNHDVKAIEYYIQKKLLKAGLEKYVPFIHFGCTSEDINNLAYGLMIKEIRSNILVPAINSIIQKLQELSCETAELPMLARTHGQPASPTTLGKELVNFATRISRQWQNLQALPILGKFNGAVGNFNAHFIAAPELDWRKLSHEFILNLGLTPNLYTTQIEPHDNLCEILQNLIRINTILIDLNRDIWGYISLEYFSQVKLDGEIGSSTMPHKINPIDFENSEGNLGMANALASHMTEKLPISRWQRDLSDSTVLRNLGTVAGYSLIAYQSLLKGLSKLKVNSLKIQQDLDLHWEVLAEGIQSVLRRHGMADAYEQLKTLTRGEKIDRDKLAQFIENSTLPADVKKRLLNLTPAGYIGYATEITQEAIKTGGLC